MTSPTILPSKAKASHDRKPRVPQRLSPADWLKMFGAIVLFIAWIAQSGCEARSTGERERLDHLSNQAIANELHVQIALHEFGREQTRSAPDSMLLMQAAANFIRFATHSIVIGEQALRADFAPKGDLELWAEKALDGTDALVGGRQYRAIVNKAIAIGAEHTGVCTNQRVEILSKYESVIRGANAARAWFLMAYSLAMAMFGVGWIIEKRGQHAAA